MKLNAIHFDNSMLEGMFDTTPDGISVLDPELNIVWLNTTIKKWYRLSEPVIGCKCYQIYHLRNHPCRNCPAIRALESRD